VAAALLVVFLIPNIPLRDRTHPMGAQASPEEDGETVIPGEAHL
jgi:hypothetical protein